MPNKIVSGFVARYRVFRSQIDLHSNGSPINLHVERTNFLNDPTQFRCLIGKFIYLTHSRSAICFCVSRLNQFLSNPTTTHFNAALRIVRYLKNSHATGLFFNANSSLTLTGFIDFDRGSCALTRGSTT